MLNGDTPTRQPMVGRFMASMKGHFANEHAVVTPGGKLLSGDPAEGLARWNLLPADERKQLPDFGAYDDKADPAPPPGGLVLRVFERPLERTADGAFKPYRHPKAHLSQDAGRDFLWMTEAEWRSLVPADPKKGDRVAVPAAIVDRICRRYLIDLVRIGGEGGPRSRENVVAQELSLTVEDVTPDTLRLRLDGSASYTTRGEEHGVQSPDGRRDDFTLRGSLDYDRKGKVFRRFDVVALSDTGHYDQIGERLVPLGVAFELTDAKLPADRVRPHSLYDGYFDAGK